MRARLQKQLAGVSRDLGSLEDRLRSVEFTGKAPAEVVAADRQRRDELSARRATLERYLGGLEE
jgi:valyl-tRNA synthetase